MAEDRTRQTAAKLHTAGPNNPDRDIHVLGPAAFGSGPSLSKESDADLSGVERVGGGGYVCRKLGNAKARARHGLES